MAETCKSLSCCTDDSDSVSSVVTPLLLVATGTPLPACIIGAAGFEQISLTQGAYDARLINGSWQLWGQNTGHWYEVGIVGGLDLEQLAIGPIGTGYMAQVRSSILYLFDSDTHQWYKVTVIGDSGFEQIEILAVELDCKATACCDLDDFVYSLDEQVEIPPVQFACKSLVCCDPDDFAYSLD